MKHINGFTLIELLFTISIISILSLLFIPAFIQVVEKQQTNHFFQLFDSDILFIQNKSLGARENARIILSDHYYVVRYQDQKEEIRRTYPKHLTVTNQINNRISFGTNGTIINPATYYFKDRKTTYKIVFPLGKGRHYIEEI